MTEDLENYRYENQSYTWEEGQVVSLPYHTAAKLVNKFEVADWSREPYEVKQVDYDNVLGASVETCGATKSDGEVCGREKPCSYHDE